MQKIAIILFDDFTDIDFFLIWDILKRNKEDWSVKILGTKPQHLSSNQLVIATQGHISEANSADIVIFTSGNGTRTIIQDLNFLSNFTLNPTKQLILSICSGALILAVLGLLKDKKATTHPRAKAQLQKIGIEVIDLPLVVQGNIVTAGGCLAATYLAAWVYDQVCGPEKRKFFLHELLPVGQQDIYQKLIDNTLRT